MNGEDAFAGADGLGHSEQDAAKTAMTGGFMGDDFVEMRVFGDYHVRLLAGVQICRRCKWPSVVTDDDGRVRFGWKWVNVRGDGVTVIEKLAQMDKAFQRSIGGRDKWARSLLLAPETYLYFCFLFSYPEKDARGQIVVKTLSDPLKPRIIMLRKTSWTEICRIEKRTLPNRPDVLLYGPIFAYEITVTRETTDEQGKPEELRVTYGAYPLDTTHCQGRFPALSIKTNPDTGRRYGLAVPEAEWQRLALLPITVKDIFKREEWEAFQKANSKVREDGTPHPLSAQLKDIVRPLPDEDIVAKLMKFPVNWGARMRNNQPVFTYPDRMFAKATELGLSAVSPERIAQATQATKEAPGSEPIAVSTTAGSPEVASPVPSSGDPAPAPDPWGGAASSEPVKKADEPAVPEEQKKEEDTSVQAPSATPDPWPATQTEGDFSDFPAAAADPESQPSPEPAPSVPAKDKGKDNDGSTPYEDW